MPHDLGASAALFERRSDLEHERLEVRLLDDVARPDVIEKVALADRLRAAADQQLEQTECTRSEAHRLPAAEQRLLIGVEAELVKAKPRHRNNQIATSPLRLSVSV